MHSNPEDRRRLLHRVVSGGAALLLIVSPQAHAQGSFAELNGVRLYYEVQGAGPALVLVHGWAINSDYWDDQVPAFREAYRVIRYDRRGFGRSSGDPDVTADPVDLKALLTHLGEEKAFVVGHSAGSATSMAFAVHYPESTAGLILTGGGGVSDFAPGGLAAQRAAFAERRRIARSYGVDSVFAQVGAGPAHSRDSLTPEQKARTRRMLSTYRATDLLHDTRPSGQTRRVVLADLPNVNVPTLLLVGERETPNVLERTKDMARRMPNARRIVLPGGGHLVNLSQAATYNEAVLRFLATVQQ
jgi:pimeloyl-ACP methyl ester carboxylesterase